MIVRPVSDRSSYNALFEYIHVNNSPTSRVASGFYIVLFRRKRNIAAKNLDPLTSNVKRIPCCSNIGLIVWLKSPQAVSEGFHRAL